MDVLNSMVIFNKNTKLKAKMNKELSATCIP
jgi:hypothetical protein